METRLEDGEGASAEKQPPGADCRVVDNDFLRVVECAEGSRELEEVGAEEVGTVVAKCLLQGGWKCNQLARE